MLKPGGRFFFEEITLHRRSTGGSTAGTSNIPRKIALVDRSLVAYRREQGFSVNATTYRCFEMS